MLPLDEPPTAINENGRVLLFSSIKHFVIPSFAKDVFPIPGGPSKPKEYPLMSPFIHSPIIFFICFLAFL